MTQIQKQQFVNNTQGWVGVTVIGPKGDERGAAVEPGGTVWLSEPEQVLTANAHRRAEDNPFIEQTLLRTNPETGEQEETKVTPLTPNSEERFVPAQARFVPGIDGRPGAIAQQAATAPEPVVAVPERKDAITRHEELAGDDDAQPNQPPKGEALPPRLTPDAPLSPTPPAEETAAEVDPAVGEETGAAPPPSGDAPEGEYAQREEVGTPVQGQETGSSSPAPYSPPQE